jgi:hypothetical protein
MATAAAPQLGEQRDIGDWHGGAVAGETPDLLTYPLAELSGSQSLGTVRSAARDRKRDVDEAAAAGRLRARRTELRRWLPPG